MTDLPTTLAESARRWPHPDVEVKRAELRRWILHYVPKGGVGAEIGAFRGHFTEVLLKHLAPSRLYVVDPWALAGDAIDGGVAGPVLPALAARQEAEWRAAAFADTDVRLVDGRFPDCKSAFEEPLDFLYLDVGDDFEETRHQLRVADKLLAPRGLLLGDDWWPDPASAHHGIYQAVNTFAKNHGWDVVAAGPYGQWAIRRRNAWKVEAR
jgi:hypothetical protein